MSIDIKNPKRQNSNADIVDQKEILDRFLNTSKAEIIAIKK